LIKSIKQYGDQAILINFEQKIDPAINAAVIALKDAIEAANIAGITFMIPAYCSLTVGYNPSVIDYEILVKVMEQIAVNQLTNLKNNQPQKAIRQLQIPVCYELPYALDLVELSEAKGIAIEKIIELHTSPTYKVYMLGFLPGFVFMGKIAPELACKRKTTPRLSVPESSVGIAGFQTGIYPTNSPGGWQILGKTPLKIFNPQKETPFLFQAGDEVNFYPITKKEFLKIAQKENQ